MRTYNADSTVPVTFDKCLLCLEIIHYYPFYTILKDNSEENWANYINYCHWTLLDKLLNLYYAFVTHIQQGDQIIPAYSSSPLISFLFYFLIPVTSFLYSLTPPFSLDIFVIGNLTLSVISNLCPSYGV